MERLVRVNQLGLVIPPQRLDCVGPRCPVARKIGHCFVDEHHLYFPYAKFVGNELTEDFRNHAFNRVRLPRCQHNSASLNAIHRRYTGARIPPVAVMERFLEEADLLQLLGVVSVKLEGLLEKIVEDNAPRSVTRRRLEDYEEAEETQRLLEQQALSELEVVPHVLHRRTAEFAPAIGRVLLLTAA